MRDHSKYRHLQLGWLVLLLIVLALAVDGTFSRTEALDRWVGTAVATAEGISFPFDFIVLVNPGVGANWEWRFRGTVIESGPLAASVSGSSVNGTLFITGGIAAQDPLCCLPCRFSGTIAGNRVDGTFDPSSCGGTGTFFLIKQ